jgi:hypothetical protein
LEAWSHKFVGVGWEEGQGRMLHITWSLVFECAVTNTDSVTSHWHPVK